MFAEIFSTELTVFANITNKLDSAKILFTVEPNDPSFMLKFILLAIPWPWTAEFTRGWCKDASPGPFNGEDGELTTMLFI
jgi:hypothetical protein